jgi:hypothetical protein
MLNLFYTDNRPIDFFNLLVDENFYKIIADEINKYAEEVFLSSIMSPSSRISRWRDVTVEELRVFLAFCFIWEP